MSFDFKKYANNLWKMTNRGICAKTGGDPEMTNSARFYLLSPTQPWARVMRRIVDYAFLKLAGQKDHCAKAYAAEDDSGFRASDRAGTYWPHLMIAWTAWYSLLIYLIVT